MIRAAITGMGVVGGFGCGVSLLKQALEKGRSPDQTVRISTEKGDITAPALLADTAPLARYVSRKARRRFDHYTRLALLGGFLALDDAGMRESRPGRMGIILATGYGPTCNTADFTHSLTSDSVSFGSPTRFSNSVHNAAAAYLAILLREKGPSLSVSQFDMSVAQALLTALIWLSEGRVDTVLVGGVDEYCNVLGHYRQTLDGRGSAGAVQGEPALAVIGEGAAFFVLSKAGETAGTYGIIESVSMGKIPGRLPGPDDGSPVILGADGYTDCLNRYPRLVSISGTIGVYTGVYGGLPVGQAFDMAIAALSLTGGMLYPSVSPGTVFDDTFGLPRPAIPLKPGRLHCLKLGSSDDYGMLTLSVN